MPPESYEFTIARKPIVRYFYWRSIFNPFVIMIGIWFFVLSLVAGIWGLGIYLLVALVYAFKFVPWLAPKQAEALRYWLNGNTLRVNEGVFFVKRKVILLDRVTDVVWVQGPLMRWCGIWAIRIQTAGQGGNPEATLFGSEEHENVQDRIFKARDEAVGTTNSVENGS
jgi:membrane protein YdbS with pleckstrin-like domain